jgi:hypothetical protein
MLGGIAHNYLYTTFVVYSLNIAAVPAANGRFHGTPSAFVRYSCPYTHIRLARFNYRLAAVRFPRSGRPSYKHSPGPPCPEKARTGHRTPRCYSGLVYYKSFQGRVRTK